MKEGAEARIGAVIGAVARQALAERGLRRVALLDDGGPGAELIARLLSRALGEHAVLRVTGDAAEVEPFLPLPDSVPRWRVAEELRRLRARLAEGALSAHPASKTALLLGGELPPEPLLPLGDLWATEVATLAGGWSAPPEIESVATAAGGIDALDAALRRYVDGRDARGLDALPRDVADRVREMLAAGRAARRDPRIVPKLGGRTLCIDLME